MLNTEKAVSALMEKINIEQTMARGSTENRFRIQDMELDQSQPS